jgi:hypothetical protein
VIEQNYLEVQAVTSGKHHFFGYYDKTPWDATGRYLLSLQVPFIDRQPTPDDAATIGMIDLQDNNRWIALGETLAWCWQQSTMLQWLPSAPDSEIIYNQRDGDRFIAVIQNVHTGETRTLPRPIYAVHGNQALSLNFARLNRTRPGYGYNGVDDPGEHVDHPDDDGIYWMDLTTGEHKLIITYDQMRNFHPTDTMGSGQHWFNHLTWAPDGSNFVWLHRWQYPLHPQRQWVDRLISAKPDGTDICIVADDYFASHIDYYSPDQIVVWARQMKIGDRYFRFTRCTDEVDIIGEHVFSTDGHCSFSPDRKWMLTDTYPDEQHIRTLILFEMATGRRVDIGRFYAPPELVGPTRCDLHPRWSRDGKQVCIDSAHEGERQMYVIDVATVVG